MRGLKKSTELVKIVVLLGIWFVCSPPLPGASKTPITQLNTTQYVIFYYYIDLSLTVDFMHIVFVLLLLLLICKQLLYLFAAPPSANLIMDEYSYY